jgi:succinyl-CoA synthetase alpha subunit
MMQKTLVRKNLYSDSVALMRISNEVSALEGVEDVMVGMATELNLELIERMGALTDEAREASPNDLLIAIIAQNEQAIEASLEAIETLLNKKRGAKVAQGERHFESIKEVAELDEGFNMAVISAPGTYAARECRNALESGMHVFLFSDNVTVPEEIKLKTRANELGLLMMGPDCGTAIINSVPLGFANVVGKGPIGIVAASGTGLQHVFCLIDALGSGISQAVGVGGRDLSAAVGGKTMLAALDAVGADQETEVIVILSKPPAPEVAKLVLEKAKTLGKPVVLCLFGREIEEDLTGITLCTDIEATAVKAVELACGQASSLVDPYFSQEPVEAFLSARRPEQVSVRGIFCGGTVCDEAMVTFRSAGIPIHSNIPLAEDERLADVYTSEGNTFIDMGDDFFTRGKPHPMIEPSLRNERIVADALLPDTAVMLLDVELGYGSHPDPAGVLLEAVSEAQEKLGERKVLWIASIIGTKNDPQGFDAQIKKLIDAGFVVTESNIRAARLSAEMAKGGTR